MLHFGAKLATGLLYSVHALGAVTVTQQQRSWLALWPGLASALVFPGNNVAALKGIFLSPRREASDPAKGLARNNRSSLCRNLVGPPRVTELFRFAFSGQHQRCSPWQMGENLHLGTLTPWTPRKVRKLEVPGMIAASPKANSIPESSMASPLESGPQKSYAPGWFSLEIGAATGSQSSHLEAEGTPVSSWGCM